MKIKTEDTSLYKSEKISALAKVVGAGLIALGVAGCGEEGYSHIQKYYGNHYAEAGKDPWSKFAELHGDKGFIRARPDTLGEFNLIDTFGDISDIEDHENPDSMQAVYDYFIRGRK